MGSNPQSPTRETCALPILPPCLVRKLTITIILQTQIDDLFVKQFPTACLHMVVTWAPTPTLTHLSPPFHLPPHCAFSTCRRHHLGLVFDVSGRDCTFSKLSRHRLECQVNVGAIKSSTTTAYRRHSQSWIVRYRRHIFLRKTILQI